MSEALDEWIARQYAFSAAAVLRSISATNIIKTRPFFAQTIVPKKGSIVASPVLGSYDPDPDYFFHWYRDSALVMDALRILYRERTIGSEAVQHFADFVRFSLSLLDLDGSQRANEPEWRTHIAPGYEQYVRTKDDLSAAKGTDILGETRVNPDGTLDISRWPRPQNDGAASRALTVLRWLRTVSALHAELASDAARLVRGDLAFSLARWRQPCFDIWEEEEGHHYYTLRIQAAALEHGAEWLAAQRDADMAEQCRAAASDIRQKLDEYWIPEGSFYRSRMTHGGIRSTKDLDIAVILAAIHAGEDEPTHSVRDAGMVATLARLEALFQAEYPINRGSRLTGAPAMGRYSGDIYYSGGAYYFATLGAAEFYFQAAALMDHDEQGRAQARLNLARGDAFLTTVRAFTPASGELSEQFDRATGAQTSAKHLAWSYAAFITCIAARRKCLAARQADTSWHSEGLSP